MDRKPEYVVWCEWRLRVADAGSWKVNGVYHLVGPVHDLAVLKHAPTLTLTLLRARLLLVLINDNFLERMLIEGHE